MATSTSSSSNQTYKPYRHLKTLTAHQRAVSCVKFSNDGTLLASASLDKTLIIWSSATLTLLHRLIGHSDGVSDLAWSSDSHYICSASDDRTLRIWDARASTGGDCVKTLRGHSDVVFCVNFNPQSNFIVSGSFDETIRVWEVKSGRCIHVINAHSMPVTSVHFNRDGSIIVSASHDGSCKIWDASNGSCLKTLIDDQVPGVSFAKFSPNGKFILVATLNDTLVSFIFLPIFLCFLYKISLYLIRCTFFCLMILRVMMDRWCNRLVGTRDPREYLSLCMLLTVICMI